jgi:hypothetical protein
VRTSMLGRCATTVSLALAIGTVAAGAGEATAAADQPGVLGTCLASVQGTPGQQVSLSPAAVQQPITDALVPLDPLNAITPRFRDAWSALPPIAIGTVPSAAGLIPGDAIAGAVVDQLRKVPAVGPVIDTLAPRAWLAVAQVCGVAVQPVAALVGPLTGGGQQPAPPSSAPPGGNSGGGNPGGGKPGGGGSGGRPAPGQPSGGGSSAPGQGGSVPGQGGSVPGQGGSASQGGVPPEQAMVLNQTPGGSGPSVLPDGVMVYNSGQLPQPWTIPGGLNLPGQAGKGRSVNPTEMTGRAEPLVSTQHARPGVNQVVVLATLLLAFVTAQLARTWARRPLRVGRHRLPTLGLHPTLRRWLRRPADSESAG